MDKQLTELKDRVDALTDDWPQLNRYRAANAALPAPAADEARVVFLGDSITDSWPGADTFFATHHYIGRGISGQTTSQMLVRLRQDVIALRPKVVVILAGTNDIAGNSGPYDPAHTQGCLTSLVELARANGIRVVLTSCLPASDYWWRRGLEPAPKIIALNAWLQAYAARTGCVYVDYHAAMADAQGGLPPKYADDGVHPNAAGYAVMEALVAPAIAAALAQP
jgi:lysophospholipase L1-like esterase